MAFPDGPIFEELLQNHRDHIVAGLAEYASEGAVSRKFEWAAAYHNFVCEEFADSYTITPDEDDGAAKLRMSPLGTLPVGGRGAEKELGALQFVFGNS